jgi:hypothetical protein
MGSGKIQGSTGRFVRFCGDFAAILRSERQGGAKSAEKSRYSLPFSPESVLGNAEFSLGGSNRLLEPLGIFGVARRRL